MANPIFNAMNQNAQHNNPLQNNFMQFMQQMRGKDPNAVLNDLVKSGKVNQNQLNQAQAMAQQMQSVFAGMRGMFGK